MAMQKVYFVQGANGAIKIGIAKNPAKRLADLQVSSPDKLKLLGCCDGGRALEQQLHAELELFRVSGEWFKDRPKVRARVTELTGYVFPPPKVSKAEAGWDALLNRPDGPGEMVKFWKRRDPVKFRRWRNRQIRLGLPTYDDMLA